MVVFQNSKTFKINELWKKDKSVSTLLIPAHLIEALKLKKKEHGKQMAVYLRDSVKEVEEFISIKTNENIFSIKPEHKRFYIQIQKMLER